MVLVRAVFFFMLLFKRNGFGLSSKEDEIRSRKIITASALPEKGCCVVKWS